MNQPNQSVRDFYNKESSSWDLTRQRGWEGVQKALSIVDTAEVTSILDLGCGNGRFIANYHNNFPKLERYHGLDISSGLVAIAESRLEDLDPHYNYQLEVADITEIEYSKLANKIPKAGYELVVILAVAHHLSPEQLRELLEYTAGVISPNGKILLSIWDFLPELSQKLITGDDLAKFCAENNLEFGENDYLLSWGKTSSYRFAHHYQPDEINGIIKEAELKTEKIYQADGKNSKLNRYFILETTN